MMEVVHHFLVKEDEQNPGKPDLVAVLKKSAVLFDGGFNIGGLIGNGHSFIMRDANGIRPSYYFIHDDFIVGASERAAIRTTFNVGEKVPLVTSPTTSPFEFFTTIPARGIPRSRDLIAKLLRGAPEVF